MRSLWQLRQNKNKIKQITQRNTCLVILFELLFQEEFVMSLKFDGFTLAGLILLAHVKARLRTTTSTASIFLSNCSKCEKRRNTNWRIIESVEQICPKSADKSKLGLTRLVILGEETEMFVFRKKSLVTIRRLMVLYCNQFAKLGGAFTGFPRSTVRNGVLQCCCY